MRPAHNRLALLLSLLALPALAACPEPEPDPADDDDTTEDDSLPEVIPTEWIQGVTGTILNRKEYVSGPLNDSECTETFNVVGNNVTDIQPHTCGVCDIVHDVFIVLDKTSNCAGNDDLEEEGLLGLDLRQQSGEAVLWWFVQGFFGDDWTELGSGVLEQDGDNFVLDFQYEFEDPDNGSWLGNITTQDPCSFGDSCSWNGYYTVNLELAFEVGDLPEGDDDDDDTAPTR